jgi:hypothetical protein
MQGILWEQVFGICGITSKHGFDVGKIFMKLHPLNNDFAWVQPGPPLSADHSDASRCLPAPGWFCARERFHAS